MGRLGGRGVAVVCWALVLCAGVEAQRTRLQPKGLERAFVEPRTPVELRRRLAGLEAQELPALFHLAVDGRLPDGAPAELPPLSDAERALVREALGARPRREIVPFLEDLAGRPMSVAERLEAQALLGSLGSGDHLKLLVRLTAPIQERSPVAPELRAGFTAALSVILARDAAALAQVAGLLAESAPGLASAIIEGLAAVRSAEATRILAAQLGRSPGLDPLILARLSSRDRARAGNDGAVLDAVRRYLGQRDPALVSAAAVACGELGDDGAVDLLIKGMAHEDGRVRASVFQALARISHLDFGPAPERWTSWYHAEMRWWDEDAEAELVRIERGRGQEFVRAAAAVLEHRLFRYRMAESFAQALQRTNVEEVRLACRALEQLRSPVAVPELVQCLERDESSVRMAAYRALRAITGVALPPEADSWAAVTW